MESQISDLELIYQQEIQIEQLKKTNKIFGQFEQEIRRVVTTSITGKFLRCGIEEALLSLDETMKQILKSNKSN